MTLSGQRVLLVIGGGIAAYKSLDLIRRLRERGASVRRILTALLSAQDIEGLQGPPGWRIHQLTGDRAGTWSISVSGNWRLTFKIDDETVTELNLEDSH